MPTKKDDDSTQNSGGDGDETPTSGGTGDANASSASVQVGKWERRRFGIGSSSSIFASISMHIFAE